MNRVTRGNGLGTGITKPSAGTNAANVAPQSYKAKKGDAASRIAQQAFGDAKIAVLLKQLNPSAFDAQGRVSRNCVLTLPTQAQVAEFRRGQDAFEEASAMRTTGSQNTVRPLQILEEQGRTDSVQVKTVFDYLPGKPNNPLNVAGEYLEGVVAGQRIAVPKGTNVGDRKEWTGLDQSGQPVRVEFTRRTDGKMDVRLIKPDPASRRMNAKEISSFCDRLLNEPQISRQGAIAIRDAIKGLNWEDGALVQRQIFERGRFGSPEAHDTVNKALLPLGKDMTEFDLLIPQSGSVEIPGFGSVPVPGANPRSVLYTSPGVIHTGQFTNSDMFGKTVVGPPPGAMRLLNNLDGTARVIFY
jgi:hypothetical protein